MPRKPQPANDRFILARRSLTANDDTLRMALQPSSSSSFGSPLRDELSREKSRVPGHGGCSPVQGEAGRKARNAWFFPSILVALSSKDACDARDADAMRANDTRASRDSRSCTVYRGRRAEKQLLARSVATKYQARRRGTERARQQGGKEDAYTSQGIGLQQR